MNNLITLEILKHDNLIISLDIIEVLDYYTETVNINSNNCEKISNNIIDIICSFGYYVIDNYESDRSSSLYFRFCNNDEFNAEEVTLIIGLRVADHELNLWNVDNSIQDARNRQLDNLKGFAHDNRWINTKLKDDEEIPVEQIYIKYENEFYTSEEDVYNKIRQKLKTFKNKHK